MALVMVLIIKLMLNINITYKIHLNILKYLLDKWNVITIYL